MTPTIEQLEKELEAAKNRAAVEANIVDRIWDILGRPSYEELDGRSIYDLVQGLKIAAKGYREDHSLSCTTDGIDENRCHWCKLVDSLPLHDTLTPYQTGWRQKVEAMLYSLRSERNGL